MASTAAPMRSRPLRKEHFSTSFKLPSQRPTLLPEPSASGSRSLTSSAPSIRHFAWSPTGALLASTSGSTIRIWDPEKSGTTVVGSTNKNLPSASGTGTRKHVELKGHTGSVEKVCWNPTREAELASTGSDGTVKVWDVRSGTAITIPGQPAASVTAATATTTTMAKGGGTSPVADVKIGDAGLFLTWSPNGREIVVGRRDDLVVPIDVRMGALGNTEGLDVRPGHKLQSTQTNQMCFSNGGGEVLATTGEGMVQILDWPSMQRLHSLNAHTSAASCVAHSPNGSYVAVGGGDSLISLWDTHDWSCKRTLSNAAGAVHNVSFSFDGTYICGGYGTDKDAQTGLEIAHVETGDVVHTVETANAVSVVAWHPSRYWLAYAGDPGGIRIIGVGSTL